MSKITNDGLAPDALYIYGNSGRRRARLRAIEYKLRECSLVGAAGCRTGCGLDRRQPVLDRRGSRVHLDESAGRQVPASSDRWTDATQIHQR